MLEFGVIQNRSVSDVIDLSLKFIKNPIAVIRCIDSSWSIPDLIGILNFHKLKYEIANENICLYNDHIKDAIKKNIFTGFDEVWLFQEFPPSIDLIEIQPLTSDAINFTEKIDQEILDIFKKTGCELLVADGFGLNYIVRDPSLLKRL